MGGVVGVVPYYPSVLCDGLNMLHGLMHRWLLRVFMSWRGYVDEWAYVRTMLVRTQRLKVLHKVYVHWYRHIYIKRAYQK